MPATSSVIFSWPLAGGTADPGMASDVEGELVLSAPGGNGRTRHRDRDRHVVAIGREPEPARRDEHRDVGGGNLHRELFLQLHFAIGFRRMGEVPVRVVAFAGIHLRIGLAAQPNGDAAISTVPVSVGAGVAEDVVRRDVFRHLAERLAEIIGVEKRRPAGIGRQRGQGLLLRGERRELTSDRRTGKRAQAAAAALASASAWNDRLQAARVNDTATTEIYTVDARGRVDGRAQLHLVVRAVTLHAGAEIEDGFLLLNGRKRFGQRLQRAQADVVVERVEFLRACVGRRRIVGLGRRFVGCRGAGVNGSERRAAGARECLKRRLDLLLVAREVRQNLKARANRRDRHQIRRCHLFVHPFDGRVGSLLHVFGLHGAGIEQQREQAMPGDVL